MPAHRDRQRLHESVTPRSAEKRCPRKFGALLLAALAHDGTDLEPSPYLLHQVHRHLPWVAYPDEVVKKRRGEILGEDPLVTEAPQVELKGA